MSELEKPKRRRFWQFHLLTGIIALLTASWMLHLNCRTTQVIKFKSEKGYGREAITPGWPFYDVYFSPATSTEAQVDDRMSQPYPPDNVAVVPHFGPWILANLFANLLILGLLMAVCEWLIRRREGRSP